MLSAAPYTLAGSATGDPAITYLWEQTAGSGTVVFADATDPETTFTVDEHDTYTLQLTATNAAGSDSDSVDITVTATLSALLTRMATGSRTCIWHQAGLGETLNSGNYSALADQGAGGKDISQGTAGNQPAKADTGSNLSTPAVSFQGTSRHLFTTSLGVTNGRSLLFVDIVKGVVGALRGQVLTREGTTLGSGDVPMCCLQNSPDDRISFTNVNGGTEENVTITSPAVDGAWHVEALHYDGSGAPVYTVDRAATSPTHTQTGPCTTVGTLCIGHPSAAGGMWQAGGMFESVDELPGGACLSEMDAIYYYCGVISGLFF